MLAVCGQHIRGRGRVIVHGMCCRNGERARSWRVRRVRDGILHAERTVRVVLRVPASTRVREWCGAGAVRGWTFQRGWRVGMRAVCSGNVLDRRDERLHTLPGRHLPDLFWCVVVLNVPRGLLLRRNWRHLGDSVSDWSLRRCRRIDMRCVRRGSLRRERQ